MYGIYEDGVVIAHFAAPMTVKSNVPTYVSDTLSLKRQASKRAAQRWEIETNIVPQSDGAHDFFVNLVTKGYSEDVSVLTPQNIGVIRRRLITSAPTASGTAGDTQVTLANVNALLSKGTFIRFSNHSKIYMTTGDISSPGTVGIFPSLRVSVSATLMYCKDDVLMTCKYDTDVVSGMAFTDGILMDPGAIKLVERL